MKYMEKGTEITLSVVVPIFNEAPNIPELYERLARAASEITENYEFIFVNDGSGDESLEVLMDLAHRDPRVFYIGFSRNFGHQIAVTAGLEASSGRAVVIMDGDLQDPPELVVDLYRKYREGFDVVYAKRRSRKGEGAFKKVTAKIFYRTMKRITSINIPVDTGDFRLMDRKVVDNLNRMGERNKFLRGQIAWLGFKQAAVVYDRDRRKHGKTGYTVGKMLRFAMDGVTRFSDKPLQFVSRLGAVVSLVSFLVILFALYSHYVLNETITGWTSLIISTMFIGGVQLVCIGVIGEYVGRINQNVLNRPLYIVESTNCERGDAEK